MEPLATLSIGLALGLMCQSVALILCLLDRAAWRRTARAQASRVNELRLELQRATQTARVADGVAADLLRKYKGTE